MADVIVIAGAKAIGDAVGVNWKILPQYVQEKGLPAFRIDGKGAWMATPEDLKAWVARMRDENIGKSL